MVNPVNPGIQQATLNPFQKRIDEQVKNPGQNDDTRENAAADQTRRQADNENSPALASSQSRNDSDQRGGSARGQRGSLLDVTV
jgi:hypothetical protein